MINFREYFIHKTISDMKIFNFESPILEVGCGTGELLELIAKNWVARGIDLSKEASAIAQQKGLEVKVCNLFDYEEKVNSIVCTDVIEHVKDDFGFVQHLYETLNTNGKLFVLVPSGKMLKDDVFYGHYRRYSKKAIVKLLERNNFTVESVEMFGYPILHYLRLFINGVTEIELNDSGDINKNTVKSSYDNAFGKTIFAKLAKVSIINSLLSKLLCIQDFFKGGQKGLAVIVIAKKGGG